MYREMTQKIRSMAYMYMNLAFINTCVGCKASDVCV